MQYWVSVLAFANVMKHQLQRVNFHSLVFIPLNLDCVNFSEKLLEMPLDSVLASLLLILPFHT